MHTIQALILIIIFSANQLEISCAEASSVKDLNTKPTIAKDLTVRTLALGEILWQQYLNSAGEIVAYVSTDRYPGHMIKHNRNVMSVHADVTHTECSQEPCITLRIRVIPDSCD